MPYISSVVIHCRDPYLMAPFWSLVTGLAPVDEDAVKLAERSLSERESVLLRHPGGGPDVWMLGSSMWSAAAAVEFGLP